MNKRRWLDQSVYTALKANKWYFDPVFLNTQHIDATKPTLYVGNHTLYGLTDAPLFWEYLNKQHRISLRSLGHDIHFKIPVWRNLLKSQGVVRGTPENCAALMRKGESILVFPGGSREVFKHKNEEHQLIWKQRTGFARLAIQHGYDIVPFAALGGDDCFDIAFDAGDVQNSKASMWLLSKLNLAEKLIDGDMIPTISTGVAKLPIPRPERLYFSFGERISTKETTNSRQGQWRIREMVAKSIEDQLSQLKEYRVEDREKNWGWIRKKLTHPHTYETEET